MAFPIAPIVGQKYTTASGAVYEWDGQGWVPIAAGGGGSTPTGTPFTFAGFDTSGDLYTIPSWTFDSVTEGAEVFLTVDADFTGGATYPNLHTLRMTVNPIANNADENWSLLNTNVNIDQAGSGFNINGYVAIHNNFISYNQPNTVEQIVISNTGGNIGDGVNAVGVNNLFMASGGYNVQNTAIQNYGGDNFYANFDEGNIDNVTLINRSAQFTDLSDVTNATATNWNFTIDNTTSTGFINGTNGNITLQNGAIVNSINLLSEYVNINDTSTLASLTLGALSASGTGTVTNVNGFQVDVSGVDSPNRKQAGGFNGGSFFANGNFTTANSVPFDQAHLIGGDLTIESGSPITGTAFIFNNLASNIVLNDDMDSGILDLGFTPVGFVGQFTGTTGNTVDRINMASSGMAIAAGSTGGNVTDWVGYHSIGVANFGGVIDSVTNVMAFSTKNSTFGTVGTNVWGVYIPQTNADNWFNKSVTIGGSTGQTADSFVGLDIAEPKTIQAGSFTTAERTAITTAAGGALVYDEDLEAFYFADNAGAWQTFGGGGGTLQYYKESVVVPTTAPVASGSKAVAIGDTAIASGTDSFAFGRSAQASNGETIAFGKSANASGNNAIALGSNSAASANNSAAFGYSALATALNATAVGYDATASQANTVILGLSDASTKIGIGTSTPSLKLHTHSQTSATTGIARFQNNVDAVDVFVTNATPESAITASIGDLAVDGTGGKLYIKATGTATNTGWSELGSGSGGGAIYDTGWVAATGGDWTQALMGTAYGGDVVHNLNTPASQLIVKLLASSDQTEANSVVIPMGSNANDGLNDEYGWQVDPVDNNNLKVITSTSGVSYIRQNGNGAGFIINSGDPYYQYYKVVVFKVA